MGGEVTMAGKPYRPIYDLALARIREKRGTTPISDVLAIGDGPETDIKGAADYGLDVVLVTAGGISQEGADPEGLAAEIRKLIPGVRIVRTLPQLRWL
jgi:ribonucleotide monophosphatase NagD (HAD superfamily)